jgi:hypothetical protein
MRMNRELAAEGAKANGGRGEARRVSRFSRRQSGLLVALLLALLAVWAAGSYWVASEMGVFALSEAPGAPLSPLAGNGQQGGGTPSATAAPTDSPTAAPTALPMPTMVITPGRIDPELGWGIFQGYLERLQIHDVEGANVLARKPLEWELCMDQGSEGACQEMLDLAYREGAGVERRDLVDVWADENQLIMGANPVASPEGEGESPPTRYSKIALMFLRNAEGEIKFLMLQSTSWVENSSEVQGPQISSRLIDSDQDGLSDYDENCTQNDPPCEQPTDPLKRDTDGDGYWDGIEVAADSDPNNPDSLP